MEILSRLGGGGYDNQASMAPIEKEANPRTRTLTQQLDDQIRFHETKILLLKEAKAALSPEVERALNALQKL
jgi:hypothetical protein